MSPFPTSSAANSARYRPPALPCFLAFAFNFSHTVFGTYTSTRAESFTGVSRCGRGVVLICRFAIVKSPIYPSHFEPALPSRIVVLIVANETLQPSHLPSRMRRFVCLEPSHHPSRWASHSRVSTVSLSVSRCVSFTVAPALAANRLTAAHGVRRFSRLAMRRCVVTSSHFGVSKQGRVRRIQNVSPYHFQPSQMRRYSPSSPASVDCVFLRRRYAFCLHDDEQ